MKHLQTYTTSDFSFYHYTIGIFLLFQNFYYSNTYTGSLSKYKGHDKGTIIYHREDKENCYSLDVIRLTTNDIGFEDAKSSVESGSFYHFDDVNETITTEKKKSPSNVEISISFWNENRETKIILISCITHLTSNKKHLHQLMDKFINNPKNKK